MAERTVDAGHEQKPGGQPVLGSWSRPPSALAPAEGMTTQPLCLLFRRVKHCVLGHLFSPKRGRNTYHCQTN